MAYFCVSQKKTKLGQWRRCKIENKQYSLTDLPFNDMSGPEFQQQLILDMYFKNEQTFFEVHFKASHHVTSTLYLCQKWKSLKSKHPPIFITQLVHLEPLFEF